LISTARLNALLRLHLRPINAVVFRESTSRYKIGTTKLSFMDGFALICFQRLS